VQRHDGPGEEAHSKSGNSAVAASHGWIVTLVPQTGALRHQHAAASGPRAKQSLHTPQGGVLPHADRRRYSPSPCCPCHRCATPATGSIPAMPRGGREPSRPVESPWRHLLVPSRLARTTTNRVRGCRGRAHGRHTRYRRSCQLRQSATAPLVPPAGAGVLDEKVDDRRHNRIILAALFAAAL